MSKTILLIDDNMDLVSLIGMRLEAADYTVLASYDGRAGLIKAKSEPVDLILLDIMMPVMDGFETLEALKADETTRDIPVVMLTAKGDSKSIFKAESLGACDYLVKPCEPARLLACLREQTGSQAGPDAP